MIKRDTTVVMSADGARRLGRYLLCGEIAEGGMGKIYLARAQGAAGFEKLFAVKVILPDKIRAHPELVEMFLDEARIAACIDHPNVCQVTDFGEERGVPYLVMEYLTGKPIHKILGALAKQPEQRENERLYALAARISAEACEGLHAAHTARDRTGRPLKIVHRDVSPENIFLTFSGSVRVMDFGIAKAETKQHETATGVFKGKLAYAPPEAFKGAKLDFRADVWGAGVVLWEMLTGLHLFYRENEAATMAAVLDEPIMPPSRVRADVPKAIDAIVMKALRRQPEERYGSCRKMAQALNKFAIASAGEHIGTAELSDWLSGLFPDDAKLSYKAAQVAQALKSEAGSIPDLIQGAGDRARISEIVARDVSVIDVPLPESFEQAKRDPWPQMEATAPLDEQGNVIEPEHTRRARPDRSSLENPIVFNSMAGITTQPPFASGTPVGSAPPAAASSPSLGGQSVPENVPNTHATPTPSSSTPRVFAPPARHAPVVNRGIGYDQTIQANGSFGSENYDPFEGDTTVHTPGLDGALSQSSLGADAAYFVHEAPTSPTAPTGPAFASPPNEVGSANNNTTKILLFVVLVVLAIAAVVWALVLTQGHPGSATPRSTVVPAETQPEERPSDGPSDRTAEPPQPSTAPVERLVHTGEPVPDENTEETTGQDTYATMGENVNRPGRAETRPATPMQATPPATPRPANNPGTLRVVASGAWADIFEGGNRLGRTPARLSLSPGRHSLTFRFNSGQVEHRSVNIRSDESQSLSVGARE